MKTRCLSVLLLLAVAVASAQVVTNRRRTMQTLDGGLQIHRVQSTIAGGVRVGVAVEVRARTGAARASLLAPNGGVWDARRLDSVVRDAGARSGLVLLGETGVDTSPFIDGLYFAEGRLLGWPATGPVLTASAEGLHTFIKQPNVAAEADATVTLADEQTFPISGVNAAPAPGGVTLLSGPYSGDISQGAYFEAGSLLVPLVPVAMNTNPHGAIWNDTLAPAARQFLTRPPQPVRESILIDGAYGLVFPPGLGAEAVLASESPNVTVSVPLPPSVALSQFTAQTGPLLEPGAAPFQGDAVAVETYLGVDASGRSLFLVESGAANRGEFPMGTELDDWMEDLGIVRAARVAVGPARLLVDAAEAAINDAASSARARLVLAASSRRPALSLPGGGEAVLLRPGRVVSSNRDTPTSALGGLTDGEFSPSPALVGYWEAPLPEGTEAPAPGTRGTGPLQWIEIRFPTPVRVQAVELLHAEYAGFSPQFNLKGWRLLARSGAAEPWRLLTTVSRDEPIARERRLLTPPHEAVQWRLEVVEPNFLPGGDTARIAEMLFWGEPAAE